MIRRPIQTNAICAAVLLACAAAAQAASVDANELNQLRAQARRQGAAAVLVHLEAVSLDRMHKDLPGVKAAMRIKAQRLIDELGVQAWGAGRWENGVGQVGLHVTEAGLRMLANSGNAVAFRTGQHWRERSALTGFDNSHGEIERLLDAQGFADIEVTANVDGLDMDLTRGGPGAYRASAAAAQAAHAKVHALLSAASDTEMPNRLTARASLKLANATSAAFDPRVTLRISRQGLLRLVASDAVRTIRPVGFSDSAPLLIDVDTDDPKLPQRLNDVLITLKTPHFGGALSAASIAARSRGHKAALDEVLADAGFTGAVQDMSGFGVVGARLTGAQLARLRANNDSRILSVIQNRPMATTQLATSTTTLNMAPTWNALYRSAGQNIIVFDTGVEAGHPFLTGTGRLVSEACFGTTAATNGVQYVSVCPQHDVNGDSPPGLAGSSAPASALFAFPSNVCSTVNPVSCSHGTHVTGIAAGRNAAGVPAGLQGISPDAGILPVQVFSFDQAGVQPPTAFSADLLQAFVVAAQQILPSGVHRPFVINMSLGGGFYSAPCTAAGFAPFANALQSLRQAGVPAVIATGNARLSGTAGIAFPACLPGAIKVTAMTNDGIGTTQATYAQVVSPADFPGETFWLAPGGGSGTTVASSVIGGNFSGVGFAGTSMAAPHISGLYAAFKAAVPNATALTVVADATAWFQANAGVTTFINVAPSGAAEQFFPMLRVRMPNF